MIRLIVPSGMAACESLDGLEACVRAKVPLGKGRIRQVALLVERL